MGRKGDQNGSDTLPTACHTISVEIRPKEDTDSFSRSASSSTEDLEIKHTENLEQDSKYGWVVVICVLLMYSHSWGLTNSYGVFLAHYLNSGHFDNPEPISLAFAAGLASSTTLLVAPFVTWCSPRLGTKPTLFLGIAIESGALIGASFTTEIWHLVLSQGIAFGVGVGFIVNTTSNIVPQWFVARRSLATSISIAGTGLGGLIYSILSNIMIDKVGLAGTFRILAAVSFTINGIAAMFIKDRNKSIGAVHQAFRFSLLQKPEFILFLVWGLLSQFGNVVGMYSLSDYAQAIGLSSRQGSISTAMFNLSIVIGRPLIGLASDRYGRLNIAGSCTLIAGLSTLFIWTFAGKSFAGLIIYSLFGTFVSSLWPTLIPVCAEIFGMQLLPSVISLDWLFLVIPSTFSMPIALCLKQPGEGGYLGVQLVSGFAFIISFIAVWSLRAWKICQKQEPGTIAEMKPDIEPETGSETDSTVVKHTNISRLYRSLWLRKHI